MKLMKSKKEIIKDYEKIINFTINKMKLGYRRDELFDIGMIGFVQGINTFDETKGYQYISYLYDCIKNEIAHHLQYESRKKRNFETISLNTIINGDTELQDLLGYETDYSEDNYMNELMDVINDRMSFMTRKEQLVFNHLYGINGYDEMTPKEITEKYGFSRQSIYQIKKITLNKLRYILHRYQNEKTTYHNKKALKGELEDILNKYNKIH